MINFAKVHFLGAAGTVTGSKFLVEAFDTKILIDCGMFQGLKELRQLNWKNIPFDTAKIDTVLLTHGHLDHVGYLPRLIKQGFRGEILGTAPTLAIAEIILKDSAKIQEEAAEKANKEKFTRHDPALPLYTIKDVGDVLKLFRETQEGVWIKLKEKISFRFQYNGHILGATFIELDINGRRFVFSGDIGRNDDILLKNPKRPEWADYLFLESTYGNKLHSNEDVDKLLSQLVKHVLENNGNLIIPSFAVERLQTLMYIIWKLQRKNKIPPIPVFIDSPMGYNVLNVFKRFPGWHNLSMADYQAMCNQVNIVESYGETWETIDKPFSKIIIAGSGMVTGGRVLTYLKYFIDKPETIVLLVGFQAEGTRGRQLQDGIHEIKFFGRYFPVKAMIKSIDSLSAHADQKEILNWLSDIHNIPEEIFLIHGEPSSLDTLRVKLKDKFPSPITIPKLYDSIELMV